MPIPDGHFRLHWDETCDDHTLHSFQDCECFNDALELAADQYARGHTLTRLINWMYENACPTDQLIEVAQMRHNNRQSTKDEDLAHMESSEQWGMF